MDGNIHVSNIGVQLEAKDIEFVKEFARCIGRVLKRDMPKPKPTEDGLYRVEASSKVLYDLLQKPVDIDRINRYVEHCND